MADVYDVITARDTYRQPVSMAEAFAELRRFAGTQLDATSSSSSSSLMTRRGVVFRHSIAEDFEAELALERRVSDYARRAGGLKESAKGFGGAADRPCNERRAP